MGRGDICAAVMGAMVKERMAWRRGGGIGLMGNRKMKGRSMAGDAWWGGRLGAGWLSAGIVREGWSLR